MTIRSVMLSSFALAALFTTAASAEGKGHRACAEDVQKFCGDVPHGEGRVMACMKAHESELSEGCRAVGEAMKARRAEFKAACGTDIVNYCSNVPKERRAVFTCLKEHKAQLSDSCKALGDRYRQERQARTEPHE